jgi:hypothetical protein
MPVYDGEDVDTAFTLTPRVALIVWGGGDISPAIYGQKGNTTCGAEDHLSSRDRLEVAMVNKCVELGVPIIGICRGAQLMCAMSGGSLVQHVNNHAGGYHEIVTDKGKYYNCPSLHHQMMYPWVDGGEGSEFEYIAWCEKARSDVYLGPPNEDDSDGKAIRLKLKGPEPEILWFPKTKSLCIQSHPEFITNVDHPFVKYCLDLTKQYVFPMMEENGGASEGSKGAAVQ